jgi:hypothetical protein
LKVEKQRVTAKSIRQAGKGKQIDGKMKKNQALPAAFTPCPLHDF